MHIIEKTKAANVGYLVSSICNEKEDTAKELRVTVSVSREIQSYHRTLPKDMSSHVYMFFLLSVDNTRSVKAKSESIN